MKDIEKMALAAAFIRAGDIAALVRETVGNRHRMERNSMVDLPRENPDHKKLLQDLADIEARFHEVTGLECVQSLAMRYLDRHYVRQ